MEHAGDGFHTRPTGHCSNLRRTSHFDVARQPRRSEQYGLSERYVTKTLGKDGIQRIAGTLRSQGAYDKTHSESTPKSTSHGARASLKHPQGASGSERRS